jgi:putative membrane protein
MRHFIIGTAVTAVAFAIVTYLLPQYVKLGGEVPQLVLVSAIFGVINAVIKPIVKLLSFPINVMTLGLFSFVVNAAMLLLLAWISVELFKVPMSVGGFPAKGLSLDAIVAAVVGSIAISIVSTVVGLVVPD